MSLEINPGSATNHLVGNEGQQPAQQPAQQPQQDQDLETQTGNPEVTHAIPSDTTFLPSIEQRNTFDEEVLNTWSLGFPYPTDEFIRELLDGNGDEEELGPVVDPRDLMPISTPHQSPKEEKEEEEEVKVEECLSFETIEGLTPMDSSQIPTILLEGDDDSEEVHYTAPVPPPKTRGRPKRPKEAKTREKRPRGRPLGSATKNREIIIPQSESEAKYLKIRMLNNEASRRCRINRKQKLQSLLMEEVVLREKNELLKKQVRMKEEQIDRLKSKLLNAIEPIFIPANQIL